MNLWHEVPRGKKYPQEFNTIIEIPRNSNNKYEIDKETGLIALDRANYNAAPYPFDYGFIPQTYWEDGDALDVVVLTTYPLEVGVVVHTRPVGLMDMIDSGDPDAKIIGVPVSDRRWEDVQDLSDLNQHKLREMKHFFETYKQLKSNDDDADGQKKNKVVVNGFSDKQAALEALEKGVKLYKEEFKKEED